MRTWIKNYCWFFKESVSFVGKPLPLLLLTAQGKAIRFANKAHPYPPPLN